MSDRRSDSSIEDGFGLPDESILPPQMRKDWQDGIYHQSSKQGLVHIPLPRVVHALDKAEKRGVKQTLIGSALLDDGDALLDDDDGLVEAEDEHALGLVIERETGELREKDAGELVDAS